MNDSVHSHFESVFIEIKANKKTFIIGSIYKPPDISTDSFNYEFQCTKHNISGKEIYIYIYIYIIIILYIIIIYIIIILYI